MLGKKHPTGRSTHSSTACAKIPWFPRPTLLKATRSQGMLWCNMPENHGQDYIAHLWRRAKLSEAIITRTGLQVQAVAARIASVEAKTTLKVHGRAHNLIIGVAFSQGDLVSATVLTERFE